MRVDVNNLKRGSVILLNASIPNPDVAIILKEEGRMLLVFSWLFYPENIRFVYPTFFMDKFDKILVY